MAIKTISLELDAYEKLKRAKRGKESFSQVVRRARFDAAEGTGASIVKELDALYEAGRGLSETTLQHLEKRQKENRTNPRISPSHWMET
jgi:hypothetical protein